jgi:hypothetical protein
MSINITKAFRSGLDILFNVAVELVRDATYYRPASFSKATGLTTSAEQAAAVKALLTNYRPQELGTVVIQPGDDKVLIRAVELAGITALAAGDYLVEASTSQRLEHLHRPHVGRPVPARQREHVQFTRADIGRRQFRLLPG